MTSPIKKRLALSCVAAVIATGVGSLAYTAAADQNPGNHKSGVVAAEATPTSNEAPLPGQSAPGSLEGKATGPDTVHLTWQASGGDVANYQVFQDGVEAPIRTVNAETLEINIASLKAGTTYGFTVKAVDADGNVSDASNKAEVTTESSEAAEADADSAPQNLTLTTYAQKDGSFNQHFLDAVWDVPEGHGKILRYEVYLNGKFTTTIGYYDADNVANAPAGPSKGGKALARITLGDHANTEYKVKIRAQLADGSWGEFSQEKTAKTQGDPA